MAAYDFPPTAGQPTDGSFEYTAPDGTLYEWNGYAWKVPPGEGGGGGGGDFEVPTQALPPAGAVDGDMFWCTDDGRLYIYYEDVNTSQWVDASPDNTAEAVSSYWSRSGTTLSPENAGDSIEADAATFAGGDVQIASDGKSTFSSIRSHGLTRTGISGSTNPVVSFGSDFSGSLTEVASVRGDGTFMVGGTIPASPNITLSADGATSQVGNCTARAFSGVNDQTASSAKIFQLTSGNGEVVNMTADGSATFGDVASNSGGAGPVGIFPNVRSTKGFNVTQVSNQQCSYTHDRIQHNAGEYVIVNNSSVGVKLSSGATSWTAQSDERLKTDIVEITDGLNKVSQLRGVTGRYTTDEPDASRSMLIAQDVQAVLPQAVSTDADGMLGVRYTEVIPLLVSALHDAKDRIEALEAEVQALKGTSTADI